MVLPSVVLAAVIGADLRTRVEIGAGIQALAIRIALVRNDGGAAPEARKRKKEPGN
jgi:hypothetical protein